MQRSTDRVLTTHVGSLIRPDDLLDYIRPLQAGEPYDEGAYAACLTRSVAGRLPEFVSVHRHSGRSTYRIILERDVDAGRFRDYWTPLERLGCSYEHASGRYYAIDVPEDSDIHAVYALLEKGVADNVWDFEEGHCGHAA